MTDQKTPKDKPDILKYPWCKTGMLLYGINVTMLKDAVLAAETDILFVLALLYFAFNYQD